MIEPLGDQDNGFAAFVHSLGYPIQENLTHNLQQGAQMKLVLVLVGFLTIILACGAEKPNVTPIGTIATTPTPTPRVIVATTPTPMPTPRVIVATTATGPWRCHAHAYPSGHRGDDCHAHAVFDTHAYYDAGTNPEGYRGGYSGPDHHSRTDGDPGANGYRCPYCNSPTNSYSYASAANTYSHTATPGE